MVILGIAILGLLIAWFSLRFARPRKKSRWPFYAPGGAIILLASEVGLFAKVDFVLLFFTPLIWTGYVLLIDGAMVKLTGHSRLHDSLGRFLGLALWSIPLWLIFEAYNLRLVNWAYLNLPGNDFLRYLGYGWSFATISPALFETTDLIEALRIFRRRNNPSRAEPSWRLLWISVIVGLAMLMIPWGVPRRWGAYLFGLVWLGFIFAFDPLNYRLGKRSLWQEWVQGNRHGIYSMCLAGFFCGFLWEFWNYWAHARWVYVFPILQNWKIFEMPVLGFLGFPPFCVECFVLYELVAVPRRK